MTLDQITKGRLEGELVKNASEAQSNRNSVGRARPFKAIEEPKPALGE